MGASTRHIEPLLPADVTTFVRPTMFVRSSHRAQTVRALGRGRSAQIIRAPGAVGLPAPPLVRQPVFVTPSQRSRQVRALARGRSVFTFRAPAPAPVTYVRPTVVTISSLRSRSVRVLTRGRSAQMDRSPGTFTRPAVFVATSEQSRNVRAAVRGHAAQILRAPVTYFAPPAIVEPSQRSRIVRVLARGHSAIILRAPGAVGAPAPFFRPVVLVGSSQRSRTMRGFTRHAPSISRAPVAAPVVTYVRPTVLVGTSQRSRSVRARGRAAIIMRAPGALGTWRCLRPVHPDMIVYPDDIVTPDGVYFACGSTPKVVVNPSSLSRSVRALARGRNATILRAPQPAPVVVYVKPKVVVNPTRVPARAATRPRATITRAPLAARAPRPTVSSTSQRSRNTRATSRGRALILRAPVVTPAAGYFRPKVVVGRRRARTTATFARHVERPRISRSRNGIGSAAPPYILRRCIVTNTRDRVNVRAYANHREHAYITGRAPRGRVGPVRSGRNNDPTAAGAGSRGNWLTAGAASRGNLVPAAAATRGNEVSAGVGGERGNHETAGSSSSRQ